MSEEFGSNIEERKERTQSKYRKTEFLKLDDGEYTIRILDPMEVKHYTHYMGYAYIACLGDECPICQNNKRILYEHPEDYREVKGWNPRRDRYYINVMDRTSVKICEKCGTESKPTIDICSACGTVLGNTVPANKIKVLSGARSLFEDLKVLSKTVRNEQDERVDIRDYDWIFVVRGKGRDKTTAIRPVYFPAKAGRLEFDETQLYDMDNTVVKLTPEEMLDVFNGASLKDVFTVRRAKKQVLDSDFPVTDNIREDIANAVDEIFNPDL